MASELATNSVHHGGGSTITIDARLMGDGSIDFEVRDEGEGFDAQPKAPGHADGSGWGLLFVDMLADSWSAGGPDSPVVRVHLEPRSIEDEPPPIDPMLGERIRDLLDVRMLLESVKDYAVYGLNRDGMITLGNAGGERLTGYPTDEILGSSLDILYSEPSVSDELESALAHGRHEHERWLLRKDGSRFWADTVITPMLDSTAALRGFAVVVRDITWRKEFDDGRDDLIARIRHLARVDDLTGLPNRRRWHEELDRELARARRSHAPVCVAMVDLDQFKDYNDEHGHLAGDDLLAKTALSWTHAVRTTDMVARYGGDEFSVILPNCPIDEAQTVVERMRIATPDPVTCSAGIACTDGTESAEAVIRRADNALYAAKRSGRDLTSPAQPG